jgi:hypothetical protein
MTKKMPALFAKNPPRAPLDNLAALVDDWIYRFGADGVEKHRRDEVVDWCAQAQNLPMAIIRACASRRPNGNLHNHQSRVPEKIRSKYAELLMNHGLRVSSFDALHDVCEELAPPGIGPVTIYDVATRIAGYMQLEVESLYLHAGVRVGWYLLHGHRSPDKERVPRSMIPTELQRLPTDEIEDFLCAYRELLKPWLKKEKESEVMPHGRERARPRGLDNAQPPSGKGGGTIYICLECGTHSITKPESGCCEKMSMLCYDKKRKGTWQEV